MLVMILKSAATMNESQFLNHFKNAQPKMYRLAKRLLKSDDLAQDAVQEVMLKLWMKKDQLSEINNSEAYAMTMIKNYAYDILKSKRHNHLELVQEGVSDSDENAEEKLEKKQSLALLEKALDQMSYKDKTIIQLREIERFEFDQIAEILEMTPVNVRVSLSRARKKLHEKMKITLTQ